MGAPPFSVPKCTVALQESGEQIINASFEMESLYTIVAGPDLASKLIVHHCGNGMIDDHGDDEVGA